MQYNNIAGQNIYCQVKNRTGFSNQDHFYYSR